MDYLDYYRRRVQLHGTSYQDRVENKLSNDFQSFRDKSPNRVEIFCKLGPSEVVLQWKNKIDNEIDNVIGVLLTDKKTLLKEGDFFSYEDENTRQYNKGIILRRDSKIFKGYFRYRVVLMDDELSIEQNGSIHNFPCHIVGSMHKQLKSYFVNTSETLIGDSHKYIQVILPAIETMNQDSKICVGTEIWRFCDADKISIPGIYFATFEKVARDKYLDDIDNKIPYSPSNIKTTFKASISSNFPLEVNSDKIVFYALKEGKIIPFPEKVRIIHDTKYFTKDEENYTMIKPGKSTITILYDDAKTIFTFDGKEEPSQNWNVIAPTVLNVGIPAKISVFNKENISLEFNKTEFEVLKNNLNQGELVIAGKKQGEYSIKLKSDKLSDYILTFKVESTWT